MVNEDVREEWGNIEKAIRGKKTSTEMIFIKWIKSEKEMRRAAEDDKELCAD